MALESAADKYFSQMNSIATRMWVDMNETKIAYEDLWKTLPEADQKEILSESIIKPEILIKYKNQREENDIEQYAVKFIIDDNNCSYRDEHSGPFSFKTQSQRDLRLFSKKDTQKRTNKKSNIAQNKPLPKSMPKSKPKRIPEDHADGNATENAETNMSDSNSNSSTLPKTGLDFLDNW